MKRARTFGKMKAAGEKIAALTAYDASFAALLAQAGCDTVLVGDSLGMVVQGRSRTQEVTVRDIAYHVSCVARGAPNLHIIADMPFGCYENSPAQAFSSATRFIAAGADMVKLEGGAHMAETIAYLTVRAIPVCAHVGLLPQSSLITGFTMQGRSEDSAAAVLNDAKETSSAGAVLIVIEKVPAQLAQRITAEVSSATIGIGAGRECDGQILVLYDMLGIYPNPPKFSKNFLTGNDSILAALSSYVTQVKAGDFPGDENILE